MKNVVFLNRWGHLYHLMLVLTDGEHDHRLRSCVCLSLQEAHQVIENWRQTFYIAPADVQDNSKVDMNDLLRGIETDFSVAHN